MRDGAGSRTVLISGAGAAGQALGYWLAHYGFRVTVVERSPAPRAGGFATDLRGAAVHVAERMGILEACRRASVHIREIVWLDRHGQPVWKTDGNFGAGGGGDVEILRDDLTSILRAACDAADGNLTQVFGDSITSLHQGESGVEITFTDGRPCRYDLVIGADGLHSTVRSLAFGPEAGFTAPLGFYAGIWTIPNLLGMDEQWLLSSLPGKIVSIMQYGHAKHTRALLLFASPPLQFDRRDRRAQARLLHEAFRDDRGYWGVPLLLDTLPDAADLYFDDVTQVRMPSWSAGRVALVGDAACAPTLISGQGTSLALVGSYVLAGELRAADGDHRIAFPAYEAAMRPYAELNQALALGSSPMLSIPDSWPAIEARDAAVKAMLDAGGAAGGAGRGDDRSAGALITMAANAIELRSY